MKSKDIGFKTIKEENLILVFCIDVNFLNFDDTFLELYTKKNKGQSLYNQKLNLNFLFFLELQTNYFSALLNYNLQEDENNLLVRMKTDLKKFKKENIWFKKIKLYCLWNPNTKDWILKSVISNKKLLKTLLSSYIGIKLKQKLSLFQILLNYMIKDLVLVKNWFIKYFLLEKNNKYY